MPYIECPFDWYAEPRYLIEGYAEFQTTEPMLFPTPMRTNIEKKSIGNLLKTTSYKQNFIGLQCHTWKLVRYDKRKPRLRSRVENGIIIPTKNFSYFVLMSNLEYEPAIYVQ